MKPGEIYRADLGEAAPHLIIVVSREELLRPVRLLLLPSSSRTPPA